MMCWRGTNKYNINMAIWNQILSDLFLQNDCEHAHTKHTFLPTLRHGTLTLLSLHFLFFLCQTALYINRIHWSVFSLSLSQIPLHCWAVFYPRRAVDQAEELVATFGKVAGPMGLRLDRPILIELRDDRTDTYIKSIQSQLSSEVQKISSAAVHTNLWCVNGCVLLHRWWYITL